MSFFSDPYNPRRSRGGWGPDIKVILAIVAFLACVFLIGGCLYQKDIRESTVTIHVTDKQAVASGHGHKYLIYTDQGTFQDTDNWFHGKTTSSDLYGAIKVGRTYTCKVTGFRVPLFSSYKNLISCRDTQTGVST